MRTTASILVSLLFFSASAQVDINKIMQGRTSQQGGGQQGTGSPGTTMQDDTSPFVPNTFIGSYRMEMHFYKGDAEQKNSPTNMHFWSTEDMTLMRNSAAERDGQEMRILTDLKGKWTYTLMVDKTGKKTAMKSRKKRVTMAAKEGAKPSVVTVTKETKVIDGRTCTKVIAVREDGTWTGWVAQDVPSPFPDMARNAMAGGSDDYLSTSQEVTGMPLEFEWVEADGSDRMVCYIRDLVTGKVDASAFSLDGYEVMEIPSFGR